MTDPRQRPTVDVQIHAREETPEQEARDLLERLGVEDAQSWSAGDVLELANILADAAECERRQRQMEVILIRWRPQHDADCERAKVMANPRDPLYEPWHHAFLAGDKSPKDVPCTCGLDAALKQVGIRP
jgi:hypothetical protein